MISRFGHMASAAAYLASAGRLVRWDTQFRLDTDLLRRFLGRRRPGRISPPALDGFAGNHILPELVDKLLCLPARWAGISELPNLAGDATLDALALLAEPRDYRILHGEGQYCLWAAKRAQARGRVFISDLTGQLPKVRYEQLAEEFRENGLVYPQNSSPVEMRAFAAASIADAVFVPSEVMRIGVIRSGISPERVIIVPYDSSLALRILSRPLQTKPDGGPLKLLFVGIIRLGKGIRHLMRAYEAMRAKLGDHIELGLVGSVAEGGAEVLANLPKGVTYYGKRGPAELEALYGASDVFIFPSLSEGFSLVTQEALASGLPVITTAAAGSQVEDGVTGFVVPPRDSDALVAAAMALYDSPDLRKRMSAAARAVSEERGRKTHGMRLEDAYAEVLSRHAVAQRAGG